VGILDAPMLAAYRNTVTAALAPVTTRPNCLTGNVSNLSDGVDTSANFRYLHVVTTPCADIRLLYANHYNATAAGPNPITVKARVEYPTVSAPSNAGQSGASVPVTFGGAGTVTIDPGGFALSDPVPVILTAGRCLYTRTYVSVASAGQRWPTDLYCISANFEGATRGAPAADLSATGGTLISTSTEPGYGPAAVVGIPVSGRPASVAVVGDSILYGSGEFYPNGYGYAARALTTALVPYVQLAKPGEKASDVTTGAESGYAYRMMLAGGCTHAIEGYARNDWATGRTLSQVQADKLTIATWLSTRRIRVYVSTSIPGTTSTDGWITPGGQSVGSGESVRVALNAWIRAGLPVDSVTGTAVAVGTPGALVAGQPGHPYAGYFEIADTVETARDSGKWKAPALVVNDAAISSGSQTLTSAGGAFLSSGVAQGQRVAVLGAGVAGGVLLTTIGATVASNTQLTLTNTASTTVSGATAGIGCYTGDGIHPGQDGAVAMATGVTTGVFV
jgi:hypothetical protein